MLRSKAIQRYVRDISFNVGVELGQILVLLFVVSLLNLLRARPNFAARAMIANWVLVGCGTLIFLDQTREYLTT